MRATTATPAAALLVLLALAGAAATAAGADAAANATGEAPQQIRVVFGESHGRVMVVTWTTIQPPPTGPRLTSELQYGAERGALNRSASGVPTLFDKTGGINRWIHSVPVPVHEMGLAAGRTVHYRARAGPSGAWSPTLNFTVFGEDRQSVTFAVYGDLASERDGIANSSLPELGRQSVDLYMHLGDIAYNLDSDDGRVGDAFLNEIQPFASHRPYMTTIGCHERDDDASYANYLNRFRSLATVAAASGSPTIRHYSFDAGPVHLVSIDTDAWIYYARYPSTHWLLQRQYDWLGRDLAAVNRTRTPWVVMVGHRTMQCTSGPAHFTEVPPPFFNAECNVEGYALREGLFGGLAPLERLMLDHGVDLYVSGHTHHYERSWPVARNETLQTSYEAPSGPVHVLSGIAGVPGPDLFAEVAAPWTAYRDEEYTRGFGRVTVLNSSTLMYQQVSHDGRVFDEFTIVQNLHGPFPGAVRPPQGGPGCSSMSAAEVATVSVLCTAAVCGAAALLLLRRQRRALEGKPARELLRRRRRGSQDSAAAAGTPDDY